MNIHFKASFYLGLSLLNSGIGWATDIEVPATGNFQQFGEILENTPSGPGEIHSSAWGQTFRLHTGDDQYLESISIGLVDHTFDDEYDHDNIDFTFHIYEWDGTKIIGDEIFSTDILSTNDTAEATKFDINLGYKSIAVETDYMWLLNVVHDGVPGTGGVEDSYGDNYEDGGFYIFHYNDGDLSLLFTDGWQDITYRDLAFTLKTSSMPPPAIFTDVPPDHWAFSQIETLAANGITNGCGPTIYCPEDPVTRSQMAAFLERGLRGSSYIPDPGVGNIFLDVPSDYWAGGWIELLYGDGITTGCGPNIYCPEDSVTREQMAVFLLRAKYGQDYQPPNPTGVFIDVDLNHWAAPWIEQLAAEGITTGCGPDIYCPKDAVTRAQMAVFLVRTFGLE